MTEKSHVAMEAKICLVCCEEYPTGSLLMDIKLRPRFARLQITGWGICEPHQKQIAEGNIALVEIDPSGSPAPADPAESQHYSESDLDKMHRTGLVMMIDREAFNAGITEGMKVSESQAVVFVEAGMFEKMLGKEGLEEFLSKNPPPPPQQNAPGSNSTN